MKNSLDLDVTLVPVVPSSFKAATPYLPRRATRAIVIHCSATLPKPELGVEDIRRWHLDQNWIDVGYNYVIRTDGTVEQGRPGKAVGSGVMGFNHETVHVCLIGGVDHSGRPSDNFTPEQRKSLKLLVADLWSKHYPGAEVKGHRDFPGVKKDCPSFDVRSWARDVLVPFLRESGLSHWAVKVKNGEV